MNKPTTESPTTEAGRLLDIVAPDTGPTARAYRRDIAERIAAIQAEARAEYSGMFERLQGALERERKRVEHYVTKEADAEATIQRLREFVEMVYAARLGTTAMIHVEAERVLRDTAPEGERSVPDGTGKPFPLR